MKEREKIEEKYKWDLSPLCKNDEECYKKIEEIDKYLEKVKKYEGKLNNKKDILNYLKLAEEIDEKFDPIILYCHLKSAENISDSKRNEMEEKLEYKLNQFSIETSFVYSEFNELSNEMLDDIIKDKKFKNYDRMFEHIKKDKKHTLSKKEEKLLSGMSFLGGFSSNMSIFSDADLKFDKIKDSKGKEYELNQSNYGVLIRSEDRELRKNAMKTLNGTFGKYIHFLSNNFINEIKSSCYFAKIRNYNSCIESALENEEVSRKVYDTLIKCIHENFDILFDYFKEKQKLMGLKDFYIYDSTAYITKGKSKKYTYDEAIEIVKKAVSPLGEEYVKLIQRAKDERWIDVMPNKDKDSGAYQTGVYGYHPYVLTNFEGDIDSIFTLAHELGHAMHSYFSDKTQPRQKSSYVIFLAEIASVTNEVLLLNYLISTAKTKDEKIFYYSKIFEEVKLTMFRQAMFAEFEEKIYDMQENGDVLTKDKLCNLYYDLNKMYFGKTKLIDEIHYEWARVPHFFRTFYVYKYAIGMICAINFANRILSKEEGALDDYFKFLSAGCSDTPIEILKKSGCDLETDQPFDKCFDYLRKTLQNWKKI